MCEKGGLGCLGNIHPALKRVLNELKVDDEFVKKFPSTLRFLRKLNDDLWDGRVKAEDLDVKWLEIILLWYMDTDRHEFVFE